MVNYPHNDLFNRGDTQRQIQIAFSGGTITNKEMHQGSFELTESLCSQESLRFGCCESSVLKFKVHNVVTSLVGQTLTVSEILNGNTAEPFYYGKYKVYSDKPTADRKYRDIVAYDAMYDILNADVASWYNSISFPCTISYLRKKFLAHCKVDYVDTELVNDDIYIEKTIDVTELSGKQVINAICEINGCFGHINRQGKFEFITLSQHNAGLYPSETLYPSDKLFPVEVDEAKLLSTSKYSACKYEDFETQLITGLQIRQEEDDIGATVGTTTNAYVVEDNFLVYGKNNADLTTIANNLLSVINNVYYRPIEYVKTNGKPYLEVGDSISIGSRELIIETYILERTISGLNGQKDEFSSKGTETYGKELNGLNKQITQIKGKYNKLTRTVDETRSEIGNIEDGLHTEIVQTATDIRAEAENMRQGLVSSIALTADQIRSEVKDSDANLQSQITQNANAISLRVTSGEVQSMINVSLSGITLSASQINLNGYFTANGDFSVDLDGNLIISGDNYKVNLTSSGLVVTPTDYYSSNWSTYVAGGNIEFFNNSKKLSIDVITYVSDSSIKIGTKYEDVDCDIYGDNGYFGNIDSINGVFKTLETITLSVTSINGHTPITSGNISSYVTDYGTKISGIETELGNLSNQYWSLDRRISALEGGS